MTGKIIANKDDLTEVVKAVTDYMRTHPEKTTVKITTETKEIKEPETENAEI